MSARGVLRVIEGGQLGFWCPGCEQMHVINVSHEGHPAWSFDGNYDAPTFQPSVLSTSGHYTSRFRPGTDACWCTYNAEHHDDPHKFECVRCHLFVRNGMIEFLSDCTHKLAGKTVKLESMPQRHGVIES